MTFSGDGEAGGGGDGEAGGGGDGYTGGADGRAPAIELEARVRRGVGARYEVR